MPEFSLLEAGVCFVLGVIFFLLVSVACGFAFIRGQGLRNYMLSGLVGLSVTGLVWGLIHFLSEPVLGWQTGHQITFWLGAGFSLVLAIIALTVLTDHVA